MFFAHEKLKPTKKRRKNEEKKSRNSKSEFFASFISVVFFIRLQPKEIKCAQWVCCCQLKSNDESGEKKNNPRSRSDTRTHAMQCNSRLMRFFGLRFHPVFDAFSRSLGRPFAVLWAHTFTTTRCCDYFWSICDWLHTQSQANRFHVSHVFAFASSVDIRYWAKSRWKGHTAKKKLNWNQRKPSEQKCE